MDDNRTKVDRTNTLMAHVRNVIAAEFEESGLMQKALSERTGIKPVPLSKILGGTRTIYADELLLIVAKLGIPLPEVFGEDLWIEHERRERGR